MAKLDIGARVTFYHWGAYKTGWIARVSPCGGIVYLTDGRWMHAESVTLA